MSSTLGKAYHKLIRGRGQGALQSVLHGLHLGSQRGAPIGFASMYLLSFLRHAQARHHSCAALFIDTRAAYYRAVRQVAIGTLQADEDVARLLSYFGRGPDDMHHLLRIVQEGGLMKEAGNKESVQAACADFHRGTWFVSSYATGHKLATTTTGSRPGESWADAIFAYIYARAMGTWGKELMGRACCRTLSTILTMAFSVGLLAKLRRLPGRGQMTPCCRLRISRLVNW